jgi:hypothetical protein
MAVRALNNNYGYHNILALNDILPFKQKAITIIADMWCFAQYAVDCAQDIYHSVTYVFLDILLPASDCCGTLL